jgi:ATP-binding cassette subfamily C exporter for protease/lipase
LILGLSCWFEIKGMLAGGGGMMIIASVLGGRMLSPMVQLVGQWRLVVNGRDAYRRLDRFLTLLPPSRQPMPLPAPEGRLSVEAVVAAAPGGSLPIIRNVSFSLSPGESLMIIGPSAAGKTALARVLTGVWPANSGKVRLDGSDIDMWDKARLGPHLGYLPQSVELFDGTLAENIARFGAIDRDKLVEATEMVGLSEMITSLPEGLNTRIGEDGAILSGGQRQRIGLARAIYGSPSFVVLDEPNASLDEAGEQALLKTLMALKARRCTTIVIAHRKSLLQAADKLLFLRDGAIAALGPRDEVLAALQKNAANAQPARLPAITGESRA